LGIRDFGSIKSDSSKWKLIIGKFGQKDLESCLKTLVMLSKKIEVDGLPYSVCPFPLASEAAKCLDFF
jgi:hypothetical protein